MVQYKVATIEANRQQEDQQRLGSDIQRLMHRAEKLRVQQKLADEVWCSSPLLRNQLTGMCQKEPDY